MFKKVMGSIYVENGGDIFGELKCFCRVKVVVGFQFVGKFIVGGVMIIYMKRNGYQMCVFGIKQVND